MHVVFLSVNTKNFPLPILLYFAVMDYSLGSVPMQFNSENPRLNSWIKDRSVTTPLTTEHKKYGYEFKPRSF